MSPRPPTVNAVTSDGGRVEAVEPEGDPATPGAPASAASVPDDVAALSYEQARDELITIVARLEAGQVGLEDSLALWQRGEALAAHCSRWLFCAISSPETATPPTLEALPGAYHVPPARRDASKTCTASSVEPWR